MYNTTYVGLDTHMKTITIATAESGRQDVQTVGIINNDSMAVTKMVKKLAAKGKELIFCYESGQLGYGLYRHIKAMGHECIVVAPSLIPEKKGDKVKTDRKDAQKLARCLRNGDLTPVWVPDEEHEALRDLVRARESAVEDLHRNRQRIIKYLLKLGVQKPEGARNWGIKYKEWLKTLKLQHSAQQMVLSEHIHTMEESENRLTRFEKEIAAQYENSTQQELVSALQGFRGIALITAATIAAEVGDLSRFGKPSQLMSYAGLVPSENSSGDTTKRGSITKAGNSHLRRIIVEAAWHYRHRPAVGLNLKKRQEGLPEEIKLISWKAQHRLNLKYRRMAAKGKVGQKAIVAVARELLGFIWSVGKALANEKAVA